MINNSQLKSSNKDYYTWFPLFQNLPLLLDNPNPRHLVLNWDDLIAPSNVLLTLHVSCLLLLLICMVSVPILHNLYFSSCRRPTSSSLIWERLECASISRTTWFVTPASCAYTCTYTPAPPLAGHYDCLFWVCFNGLLMHRSLWNPLHCDLKPIFSPENMLTRIVIKRKTLNCH